MKLRIASTGWKRRRTNDSGVFTNVESDWSLECRMSFSTGWVVLSNIIQRMNLIESHWHVNLRTTVPFSCGNPAPAMPTFCPSTSSTLTNGENPVGSSTFRQEA
uniref:(northern house mosquito) hypothetical protein n=1 Tax=Culex pipiens TaxID=7175 RepID=A0A8D8C4A5_CULPI